jgi:hypothetical protein
VNGYRIECWGNPPCTQRNKRTGSSQSKDLYPQPSADSRVLRLRESARKTSELTAFRMTWQLHIRLLSPNELTIQANRFAYATWSLARSPIRR